MTPPPPPPLPPQRVQRVLQLDAQRLDDDLLTLFQTTATTLHRRVLPHSTSLPAPHVCLLLRALHHLHTHHLGRPTPGAALQSLFYTPSSSAGGSGQLTRAQRALLLALDIAVPFAFSRLQSLARRDESAGWHNQSAAGRNDSSLRAFLPKLVAALLAVHALARLLNRAAFLRGATYATLSLRTAGATLAYAGRPAMPRAAFTLMDQQLVWQGVATLAQTALPLLRRIARTVRVPSMRRWLLDTRETLMGGGEDDGDDGGDEGDGGAEEVGRWRQRAQGQGRCVVCQASPPVMQHVIFPCACIACYVCAQQRLSAACPTCGNDVMRIERVQPPPHS